MADSDHSHLFDPQNSRLWGDEDRAAYLKGYSDYGAQAQNQPPTSGVPSFDPPAGCEWAYQAGWDKAKAENDAA